MECDRVRELLSAYLDGEVTEKERQLILEHLVSCKACRQELEELRLVVSLVAALPREAAPEGFAERTMDRLPAARMPARARLRRALLRPRWAFASGALATAALILIAMGLLYWRGPGVPSALVLPPAAKVSVRPTPETTFDLEEAEVAEMERLAVEPKVVSLPETEISEQVPSASEVIALAQAFREDILAERKAGDLRIVPVAGLSRWEKEMAAREEAERKERNRAQTLSNSLAFSFVQKKGIADPEAQFIYLASRDLENARKELEDILAFTEKNGRLASGEQAPGRLWRGRALFPIGIAPVAIRAKISRERPLARGFAYTVNLTHKELERVMEQAIWADNFITTAIEWPARPVPTDKVRERLERRAELEKMEEADEAAKPFSQTVLILLEEER